jgi:hypothetical protein
VCVCVFYVHVCMYVCVVSDLHEETGVCAHVHLCMYVYNINVIERAYDDVQGPFV